jgi:DNA-binding IscR family transcriptional regulator
VRERIRHYLQTTTLTDMAEATRKKRASLERNSG